MGIVKCSGKQPAKTCLSKAEHVDNERGYSISKHTVYPCSRRTVRGKSLRCGGSARLPLGKVLKERRRWECREIISPRGNRRISPRTPPDGCQGASRGVISLAGGNNSPPPPGEPQPCWPGRVGPVGPGRVGRAGSDFRHFAAFTGSAGWYRWHRRAPHNPDAAPI